MLVKWCWQWEQALLLVAKVLEHNSPNQLVVGKTWSWYASLSTVDVQAEGYVWLALSHLVCVGILIKLLCSWHLLASKQICLMMGNSTWPGCSFESLCRAVECSYWAVDAAVVAVECC